MPGFTESSITLNFPDTNFFRLADCAGYRKLSGNNFKEMDACWYDSTSDIYWLIELKDFSAAALNLPENISQRSWDMLKKAIDTLFMFLCVKHNYGYSQQLVPCFSQSATFTQQTEIKIVNIVHCDPAQIPDVQLLHNDFRNKFKPYAELFGVRHYAVMEHSSAIRNLPNNMVL
jgi:hypothetical protein